MGITETCQETAKAVNRCLVSKNAHEAQTAKYTEKDVTLPILETCSGKPEKKRFKSETKNSIKQNKEIKRSSNDIENLVKQKLINLKSSKISTPKMTTIKTT